MFKLYKWLLISTMVIFLTACGGGSSTPTGSTPTTQEIAIDYIANYAQNGGTPPTVQHYIDAGVEGVTVANLDTINQAVENLTYEDVDTEEELDALALKHGITIPSTPDTTAPVITLNGANPITVIQGNPYNEPGATAVDDRDGNVTVTTTGNVDTATVDTYTITYKAKDAANNEATETRTVNVVLPPDTTPPVITLNGSNPMTVTQGNAYNEPGATANDDRDGNVAVAIAGSVDTNTLGDYNITYTAKDAALNESTEIRTVTVIAPVPPVWSFKGSVANGTQFDAQAGPNNLVHIISSRYYQIDLTGAVVVDEAQGDGVQSLLGFSPAIAVGEDGSVHIITRHDGSASTGHDIRYRRRNVAGTWDRDYIFGSRVARNYVVGVTKTTNDVTMSYTEVGDGNSPYTSDVSGDIHLWQPGSTSATFMGSIVNEWRADADSRLRGSNDTVYLISGAPEALTAAAYISQADEGSNLRNRLATSTQTHNLGDLTDGDGRKRRGFPDVAIDGSNNAHFTYGAVSEVYYNKYDANGNKVFANDKLLFDSGDLGNWDLGISIGLSAIAVSNDGSFVVAIGLKAKGDNEANNTDIMWTYSTDGGATWSDVQDTGKNTDTGEGRRRPRLVAIGNTFVLLFGDTNVAGISMGVLAFDASGNTPPVANAGGDQTVEVNQSITITGSGTDSDGSIVGYEWKKGSTVLATTASFDYTPDTVGTDTLTLTVTDNNGSTDTDNMKVTVTGDLDTWTTGAYANNEDRSQVLQITGASDLTITVTGNTEAAYDFIYLYDENNNQIAKLDGAINTTLTVQGSSITARLVSDYSVTDAGVTVTIAEPAS